jgi:O-antigen ligase
VKSVALKSYAVEVFASVLVAIALLTTQVLVGGTRQVFSLPAYALLGVGALLLFLALNRSKPDPDRFCLLSAGLFFGFIVFRCFASPDTYLARIDMSSVLGGLLVYFFATCFLTESKPRAMLLLVLLVFGMAHVLVGIVQFRNGDNFMLIPFLQRFDYGRRASGFYVCPNHLAGLLEVVGIFGVSITCWSRFPLWAKLLSGYATAVCYFGLILTGSRGGYLSALGSLLLFIVMSGALLGRVSARLFWKIGGPGILIAVLIGVAAFWSINQNEYLSDRAHSMFERNVRLDMWKAALQQFKLQPFFGTGSGTYLYYGRQFRAPDLQADPVYVHNDYLQLLAEYGLVGAALFLVFLFSHLANGWKNFQRLGPKRVIVSHNFLSTSLALNLGALGAVFALIIHSFLDFNLHIPANVLLLALVFGILANAGVQYESQPVEPQPWFRRWRLVTPALGLIVLVQSLLWLPGEYFAERARTALRDDELETGAAFALRGLNYDRKNPNLYQYLGSARFDQADRGQAGGAAAQFYQEALAAFEKGRALAPREEAFAIGVADSYDALQRFAEGEWIYEQAVALDPRSESLNALYKAHLKKWRDSGTTGDNKSAQSNDTNNLH